MRKALIKRPETAVDVYNLLPEGVLCQVINNVIYMSPAPSFEHRDIITELSMQIRLFVSERILGKCVVSPVDVYLDKHNVFQPYIIYIAHKDAMAEVKNGKVYGAPELVIEVLSPGNADDDRVRKKKIYEKHGVKEFFIVAPNTKDVTSYYHNGKKFEQKPVQKAKIVSKMLKKTFKF